VVFKSKIFHLFAQEFFENVNEQLINEFLNAGKPLLQIKNESDSADIKKLMDTLSGQWKVSTT
jgi:type IV secretory pathway TrbF-like protein